jgi:hypothetical protein
MRATLTGYERKLDNRSAKRGLAYSVRENVNCSVEGIIHDVPIADLPAFLSFEGIVNEHYSKVKQKDVGSGWTGRRYDIKRVNVAIRESTHEISCFTLMGCCPVPAGDIPSLVKLKDTSKKLISYVETAMKGAITFGIGLAPFQQDLETIREWLGTDGS